MKVKKITAVILAVVMISASLAGCGSSNTSNGENNNETAGISIGLATDEAGANDKSFNQSANTGLEKAEKEFGFQYIVIESQKKEDYEPNLQALVDSGCQLSFATGYQLADAITAVAKNNPDMKFCLVDTVAEGDNIKSIVFKEEEGSFLVGVIAGLTTKTNKIGFIGGKDQETIVKFESGFAAGVAAVNPEAAKGLISTDGKTPGATVKYADSFADTNKGYELAKSLYESGCDIIYHAAGGVGIGMFQVAKQLKDGGKDVWGIGVDMDQAISLPEYAEIILTSMIKDVEKATYDTAKSMVEGNFKTGTTVLGISEGGVRVSESTAEKVSPEILARVNELENKIKSGEIIVPATRQGVIEFKIS